MTPEVATELFKDGLYLALALIAIIVIPGLLVGLLISILQAATQINEMSLTVVPKIIVTFVSLLFSGSILVHLITDYTSRLIHNLPYMVG